MDRKSNNFKSVIDIEITVQKEGFDPSLVGYQKKHIWAKCRYCGVSHRLLGANYKKNRTEFHPDGSACHNECRFKEQSEAGSPLSDPNINAKAQRNKTKNISQEEINKRISDGRKSVQNQIEQTCLEKYGVTNPFQAESVKIKIKQTMLSKYGVENPQQDLTIRTKTRNNFNKTVENDLNDNYVLINTLRSNEFWNLLGDPNWNLKSICEHFGIVYNSVLAKVQMDEFRDRYYNTYTFPSQQQQKEIALFLSNELGLKISENDRSIISPLELDIFAPSKNIAIEFNGSAWHSEMKANDPKKQHLNKTNRCREKGIRLIHIFEENWNRKKQQWKNLLRSAMGCNQIKLNARECSISKNGGFDLIEKCHIQGCPSHLLLTFDLIYNNEIVGTIGLSGHHRQVRAKGDLIFSRMAFAENTTIRGGASKLFNAVVLWAKENQFKNIISWSDSSWTEGEVYSQLGFNLSDESYPDYFYWDSKKNIYLSKQSQKKSAVDCPVDLTEDKWAQERGLYRIWDCGKKRWEYKL